jgi:hypothetical protein
MGTETHPFRHVIPLSRPKCCLYLEATGPSTFSGSRRSLSVYRQCIMTYPTISFVRMKNYNCLITASLPSTICSLHYNHSILGIIKFEEDSTERPLFAEDLQPHRPLQNPNTFFGEKEASLKQYTTPSTNKLHRLRSPYPGSRLVCTYWESGTDITRGRIISSASAS